MGELLLQGGPLGLVAGLSQQGEHVPLVGLHPRLVEGVHVEKVAGEAAGVLKEVDELTQGLLVPLPAL